MKMELQKKLEKNEIKSSVPCRVDFGGTLDISTFYLPLNRFSPSSFNIALDLRTYVTLSSYKSGWIKISSKGFESAEFKSNLAPYNHPMGLMFAIADYFNAQGVHIQIESTSPPRSAMGGSSSAAVAMAAAFFYANGLSVNPGQTAWLGHYIESSVAGIPCGMQDQLAAAFGGVNQWFWRMENGTPSFTQKSLVKNDGDIEAFNDNILVAYCGIPHVSKDINNRWVTSFINGDVRKNFERIAIITEEFSSAVQDKKYSLAKDLMIEETTIRLKMTPDVLDNIGKKLFERAVDFNCGARFTGAGGGGCVWAIGRSDHIKELKPLWNKVLEPVKSANVLDTKIDNKGINIF
jgi:D-glycero-alpha-D-manno-heptose-7-phosphate kinase